MKYSAVIFFISLVFISCKETPVKPEPQVPDVYAHFTEGTYYRYAVDTIDASGVSHPYGTSSTMFSGTIDYDGTSYLRQIDSLVTNSSITLDTFFVRATSAGVFYAVDTAGVSVLIPDTVKPYTIIDRESQTYSFPVDSGRYWNPYLFLVLNQAILEVHAKYTGTETLSYTSSGLPVTQETKIAEYELRIFLPDFGAGEIRLRFTARVWLAKDIGAVRLEGKRPVLQFLQGRLLDLADTTTVFRKQLTGAFLN